MDKLLEQCNPAVLSAFGTELTVDLDVSSANESIHINFTRPSGTHGKPILDEPFHPTFTYPIFGDEESIVGYKKPRIDLSFRANDLKPSLRIQFQEEIKLDGLLPKDKQQNLDTIFQGILPPCMLLFWRCPGG